MNFNCVRMEARQGRDSEAGSVNDSRVPPGTTPGPLYILFFTKKQIPKEINSRMTDEI